MTIRKSVIIKLSTNKGLGLIMMTLDCAPNTARKLVAVNEPDGDLTKASMIKAIAKEYVLTEDEILIDETSTEDTDKNSVGELKTS